MIAKVREDLSEDHAMGDCCFDAGGDMLSMAGKLLTRIRTSDDRDYHFEDYVECYYWHKSWLEWVELDGIRIYENPEILGNDNKVIEFLEGEKSS